MQKFFDKYKFLLILGIMISLLILPILLNVNFDEKINYPLIKSNSENIGLNSLGSTNPSNPTILSDDAAQGENYAPGSYYYKTGTASSSYYHIVWLNFDSSDDFDLYLYSNSAYSTPLTASRYSCPEWVLFRPSSSQVYYPKVYIYSGAGWAYIEWTASSTSISIGGSVSASLSGSECAEIYKVSLSTVSIYTFTLDMPSAANYDLYLYYLSSGSAASSSGYVRCSASSGSGTDEAISGYIPSTTGDYALLVVGRLDLGSDPWSYTLYTSASPAPNTITVTTPSSSTSWFAGSSQYIYWSSTGSISNVQLDLYKGSTLQTTIVTSTSNDGSHSWAISSSLAAGTDYRIKITSTSDSGVYDYSDYFTITEPTQQMTLYQAIFTYSSLVSVTIKGTGSFYGQCISLTLEQMTSTDVTVTIEKGVKIVPSGSSYQTMIVSKSQTFSLTYSGHTRTVTLYAFCAEIHDDVPTSSITFSVSASGYSSTSNVGKILIYLESHTSYYSTRSAQCAIWACTDGVSSVTGDYYGDEATRTTANTILSESGTGKSIPKDTGSSISGFSWLFVILGLVMLISMLAKVSRKKQFSFF